MSVYDPGDNVGVQHEDEDTLPELPLCPPHKTLYLAEHLEIVTSCLACTKNHRDDLLSNSIQLAGSLAELMTMIGEGRLVRNVSHDGDSDYALRMMRFTRALAAAQRALARAEELKFEGRG